MVAHGQAKARKRHKGDSGDVEPAMMKSTSSPLSFMISQLHHLISLLANMDLVAGVRKEGSR